MLLPCDIEELGPTSLLTRPSPAPSWDPVLGPLLCSAVARASPRFRERGDDDDADAARRLCEGRDRAGPAWP